MSARIPMLLATCAGLAYMSLGQEGMDLPPPPPPGAAGPSSSPPIEALPEPSAGPWPEQTARPLFVAGRRPPAAAEPPPQRAAAEPPPPVAATGVVLRPGIALALLRLADGRATRVAVGDDVEGWVVTRISEIGVDLTHGRRTVTLAARVATAGGLSRRGD